MLKIPSFKHIIIYCCRILDNQVQLTLSRLFLSITIAAGFPDNTGQSTLSRYSYWLIWYFVHILYAVI